ncbi:hypothetical protein C8R45DRAFT_1174670 [Mycena sanguinolenta]|nr:hypothetical protein C8R45DRAFT_1174670 [Mycena sanguinolenta]
MQSYTRIWQSADRQHLAGTIGDASEFHGISAVNTSGNWWINSVLAGRSASGGFITLDFHCNEPLVTNQRRIPYDVINSSRPMYEVPKAVGQLFEVFLQPPEDQASLLDISVIAGLLERCEYALMKIPTNVFYLIFVTTRGPDERSTSFARVCLLIDCERKTQARNEEGGSKTRRDEDARRDEVRKQEDMKARKQDKDETRWTHPKRETRRTNETRRRLPRREIKKT